LYIMSTSYGIILFFRPENEAPKFLIYKRRDSYAYIDFMMAKWSTNDEAKSLYLEMTPTERKRLQKYTYKQLIYDISMGKIPGPNLITKYQNAFDRIKHNLADWFKLPSTHEESSMWGFPKGHPFEKEDHLSCAIRELGEETGVML